VIEVQVQGLDELRRVLQNRLPNDIQTNALQSTLAKAALPIVREARAKVPVRSGILRKGIYSYKSRLSTKERAVRFISVRSGRRFGGKDAYYWRWVEFGRGEVTVGKKRGAPRGGERAASLGNPTVGWFGKSVKAVPARPFLRPAFEAKKFEALETFRRTMIREVEKSAARVSSRSLSRFRRGVLGA
jgi:HK97 gp10 family phage protein